MSKVAAPRVVSNPLFGEPSTYGTHTGTRSREPAAVIADPLRRWTIRALGRSPLTRVADRVEVWAVVAAFVMLVGAAFPALAIGQQGYSARTQDVAAETASRHSVLATALGDTTSDASISESVATTFTVNVRWFAQNASHEATARLDQPAKAGDQVRIWVTDRNAVTTAPSTDADARITEMGTVALAWLAMALLVGGAFALVRMKLNSARDRRWDRSWRALVENGGGSATITP